jgi:hypothetical protein
VAIYVWRVNPDFGVPTTINAEFAEFAETLQPGTSRERPPRRSSPRASMKRALRYTSSFGVI